MSASVNWTTRLSMTSEVHRVSSGARNISLKAAKSKVAVISEMSALAPGTRTAVRRSMTFAPVKASRRASGDVSVVIIWNAPVASAARPTRPALPDGGTLLSIDTRVVCADAATRRRFLWYWRLIQPGSGLIRRAILSRFRREAERSLTS